MLSQFMRKLKRPRYSIVPSLPDPAHDSLTDVLPPTMTRRLQLPPHKMKAPSRALLMPERRSFEGTLRASVGTTSAASASFLRLHAHHVSQLGRPGNLRRGPGTQPRPALEG